MEKEKENEIIIEIDEDGRITADAHGFHGEICISKIKELIKDMPPIDSIDKKPDFFEGDLKKKVNLQQRVRGDH